MNIASCVICSPGRITLHRNCYCESQTNKDKLLPYKVLKFENKQCLCRTRNVLNLGPSVYLEYRKQTDSYG